MVSLQKRAILPHPLWEFCQDVSFFVSLSLPVPQSIADGYVVQRMLTTSTTLMVAQSDGYWWSVKPTICLVCFLQINILATAPMVRQSSVTSGNIVISFCPAVPSTVRMVSCAGQCPWYLRTRWFQTGTHHSLYINKYYINDFAFDERTLKRKTAMTEHCIRGNKRFSPFSKTRKYWVGGDWVLTVWQML